MKKGAWTEPGIQSREKRTFVSARADWTAVSERAAKTTAAMQRARNVTFTLPLFMRALGRSNRRHPI